ncbi:MAG TPA: protein kinase [Kofleriaceae bacterium]
MAKTEPPHASTEPPGSCDPMIKARPGDPAGLPLARARVFGALFGERSTVGTFGRFRVLDRLGAGGMGVVYEAYDPTLARGVALKLIGVAGTHRAAALAEAQALARLSHPNVVPIFDVDIERDHVYLVMELIRGKTLRDWPKDRSVTEIVAVYRQAGAALAAAHGAGLVHRDFKPDNAIVGADGRVRVVDFGLACEADDPGRSPAELRRPAGTPRFMAPEIKAGAAITPAADQYSFCVALAEALEVAREPPPRRITAALDRGRAADPTERFRSMDDLLHALARNPGRTWRRVGGAGALATAVAAIAFFAGRQRPEEPDACTLGAAQLEAAWAPPARSAALERLAALGPGARSVRSLLTRELDAHDRRWVSEYRAACLDRRRGTESDALIDRRTTCLQRGSDALAAVGELIEHATPADLAGLPRAVQAMSDPTSCSDRDALLTDVAPPPPSQAAPVAQIRRDITRARIHVGAGRYDQALAESRDAVTEARELGYGPTLAEALVVQGYTQIKLADRKLAVPLLAEATVVAISSHADALAIEAWARRAWAVGTSSAPDGALAGLAMIEPFAARTASAAFERALLYNNLGSIAIGRDDRAAARSYLERALTEAAKVRGRALELVAIRANLALATDDRARGDKLFADVIAELADRLGPDHPDTLDLRQMRGFVTVEDLQHADEVLTPVCQADDRDPLLADRAAECWTEVGLVRWDLSRRDAAIDAMTRAARAPDGAPTAVPYLALLRGDARAAARQFADALAAARPLPSDPWWARLERGDLLLGLGRARRAMTDLRGARPALEAAVAALEGVVRSHPQTSYERRLGRARVQLALTAKAASSPDAVMLGAEAVAWLVRVGGTPQEIAELTATGSGGAH